MADTSRSSTWSRSYLWVWFHTIQKRLVAKPRQEQEQGPILKRGTAFVAVRRTSGLGSCAKDWHPAHPAVLAVGLYDGTVLVYDVRARTKKPIYQSTVRTNKHTDPVWEASLGGQTGIGSASTRGMPGKAGHLFSILEDGPCLIGTRSTNIRTSAKTPIAAHNVCGAPW